MFRKSKLIALFIASLLLVSCSFDDKNTPSSSIRNNLDQTKTNGIMQAGQYVQFGSYNGERILWRIMQTDGNTTMLWSEYVLSAKCYDAAESGAAGKGNSDSEKFGSNVWSNSNLREWLNGTNTISFSSQSPTLNAIAGKNNYETENGFLTDFTDTEINLIAITKRSIKDSNGTLVENTEDRVFIPSYEEIKNNGTWGLNDNSRKKIPTSAAVKKDNNEYLQLGEYSWYYCDTADSEVSYNVLGVYSDGDISWCSVCYSSFGIVPALNISTNIGTYGDGSIENPWRLL